MSAPLDHEQGSILTVGLGHADLGEASRACTVADGAVSHRVVGTLSFDLVVTADHLPDMPVFQFIKRMCSLAVAEVGAGPRSPGIQDEITERTLGVMQIIEGAVDWDVGRARWHEHCRARGRQSTSAAAASSPGDEHQRVTRAVEATEIPDTCTAFVVVAVRGRLGMLRTRSTVLLFVRFTRSGRKRPLGVRSSSSVARRGRSTSEPSATAGWTGTEIADRSVPWKSPDCVREAVLRACRRRRCDFASLRCTRVSRGQLEH